MEATWVGERAKAPATYTTFQEEAKCRLFSLPPELRNSIYRLALAKDDAILVTSSPWPDGTIPNSVMPGLLRTCRQTRNEASNMFYDINIFRFPAAILASYNRFLGKNVAKMRRIQLAITGCDHLVIEISLKGDGPDCHLSWRQICDVRGIAPSYAPTVMGAVHALLYSNAIFGAKKPTRWVLRWAIAVVCEVLNLENVSA